jgi:hypothetical protein
MAGISGAVLLAPLQLSVLGAAGPVVSATSLLFNVIATPGALYRYLREGRLVASLAALLFRRYGIRYATGRLDPRALAFGREPLQNPLRGDPAIPWARTQHEESARFGWELEMGRRGPVTGKFLATTTAGAGFGQCAMGVNGFGFTIVHYLHRQ